MGTTGEYIHIPKADYDGLLQMIKNAETEKRKIERDLRALVKRSEINKLNVETQYSLTKIIADEKQRQEMYVRLLLESCPDIMFIFDENLKFLLGTHSITRLIGIDDVSLLLGRTLDNIVERFGPPAFTDEMTLLIKRIIICQGLGSAEAKLTVSTDSNKYEVNILPFYKDSQAFAGVLIVMHDITDITETKEIAERASRAKGEFLSRMSHEMRTPMNTIIGMTNIAKNSNDMDKKTYCLEKIEGASKHLLGVINDILDMSKIEADKFELSYNAFDFEKMLINITNVVHFRVEEQKQNLIIDLDDHIPAIIVGDELRLTQVITNLLTNAVKFTPEGGTIRLSAKNLPVEDGKPTLRIEVSDTGIGISPEHQTRLFNSFEQADGGTARKYGGTGLGLAISKRIVELMEGKIWIESELNAGARFIFTFTYQTAAEKHPPRMLINRSDIRVLAVDDSPEIRDYFTDIMTSFKLPCDVAADGYEALSLIENYAGKPYNIFFIDWRMPRMNGIELARKIKAVTAENSIIIMISAVEWSDIEKDAAAAGVRRFIAKPLFPSALINAINECAGFTVPVSAEPSATPEKRFNDFSRHTVLIAEDIDVNREIMSAILEETGISIEYAVNGLEAVSKFQANPERYSLIFMDIHMPEMDGYEATRHIRALDCANARTIPIIAMTANVFREDVENCLAAGMNNHVCKPIDPDDLLRKLDQYLF